MLGGRLQRPRGSPPRPGSVREGGIGLLREPNAPESSRPPWIDRKPTLIAFGTVMCRERDQLMEKYRLAVLTLGNALLMVKAGKGTAEFDRLFKDSEDCRTPCDQVRRALEEHRALHGC